MTNARTPRQLDTRETYKRPEQWAPSSLLPEINKQPGWAYHWVRTSMVGTADALNVSAKLREGWEPVKLSDHPEVQLYVDQATTRFKDSIEVGGLLLCKTPENFVKQRNDYFSNQTRSQAEAVDNSLMKENDARMPLFNEKRSTTSFGKGK